MTEAEWLACADSKTMRDFLWGRVTNRKWRLFACACCRRLWPLIADERGRAAILTAEEFIEGLVGHLPRP